MIGRLYTWRGRTWRVVTRWRNPDRHDGYWLHPASGRFHRMPQPDDAPASFALGYGDWSRFGWQKVHGCPRNVLIEDVETGERTVRPFSGLRRAEVPA